MPVPRKRKGGGTALGADRVGSQLSKTFRFSTSAEAEQLSPLSQAHGKFLQQVYDAAVRHFNFDELKVLIIASPGFTKEAVHSYLLEEAVVSPCFGSTGSLDGCAPGTEFLAPAATK